MLDFSDVLAGGRPRSVLVPTACVGGTPRHMPELGRRHTSDSAGELSDVSRLKEPPLFGNGGNPAGAHRSHRRMARRFSERTILQHVMENPPAYS
jgi:hypothetical protein